MSQSARSLVCKGLVVGLSACVVGAERPLAAPPEGACTSIEESLFREISSRADDCERDSDCVAELSLSRNCWFIVNRESALALASSRERARQLGCYPSPIMVTRNVYDWVDCSATAQPRIQCRKGSCRLEVLQGGPSRCPGYWSCVPPEVAEDAGWPNGPSCGADGGWVCLHPLDGGEWW